MTAAMTNEAARMLARADHVARSLMTDAVGTEHMLYAYLVVEDGQHRLDNHLTAGKVIDAILDILGHGLKDDFTRPGMTPRLQRIMTNLEDGDEPITPKLILDAIFAEGVGIACQIVVKILYKNIPEVRQQLALLP